MITPGLRSNILDYHQEDDDVDDNDNDISLPSSQSSLVVRLTFLVEQVRKGPGSLFLRNKLEKAFSLKGLRVVYSPVHWDANDFPAEGA